MIDVSVIIVSFNTKDLLAKCLESVRQEMGRSRMLAEVIVVDNGSKDGSREMVNKFRIQNSEFRIKLIGSGENLGFGRANNAGAREAKGRYLLFLNPDTEVRTGTLGKMVEFLDQNPKVGIASCQLVNTDGSVQFQGGYLPRLTTVAAWALFLDDLPILGEILPSYQMRSTLRTDPRHHFFGTLGQEPSLTSSSPLGQSESRVLSGSSSMTSKMASSGQPVDILPPARNSWFTGWVGGTAMFVGREAWEELGGFDEKIFMYGEDVELCYRANQKGWKVAINPEAEIVHQGRASGGKWVTGEVRGLLYIFKKHKPKWEMPFLRLILGIGMGARWLIFGILGGNEELRRGYAESFKLVRR